MMTSRTTSYRLFLDDIRNPDQVSGLENSDAAWVIARNYLDFCRIIENRGMPSHISFDHDLTNEHGDIFTEKTGYDCAKWLCDYCITFKRDLPTFTVHSMNPVGRHNIASLLENFKLNHIK